MKQRNLAGDATSARAYRGSPVAAPAYQEPALYPGYVGEPQPRQAYPRYVRGEPAEAAATQRAAMDPRYEGD